MSDQPVYPSRELLQRGPPPPGGDSHRREKWCRIAQVVAEQSQNGTLDYVIKGPFTIPMGVRKEGVALGESHKAWVFFSHPYHVFAPDGGFYNMPTKRGILAATLVERTPNGVVLMDEVGTSSTERVSGDYCGALGGMRYRLYGCNPQEANDIYVRGFLNADLLLLKTFRILTLLLKTRNPQRLFQELDMLLRSRTVFTFFGQEFSKNELTTIRKGALSSSPNPSAALDNAENPFSIRNDDFMTAERLRDGAGRQIVGILKKRFDQFRTEHGDIVDRIEARKAECQAQIQELREKIASEQERREKMAAIGRFISGRLFNMNQAADEAAALEFEVQELDRKIEGMPQYNRIRALTKRFRDFDEVSRGVERLATNIFDYNVSLPQIKELETLQARIFGSYGDERAKNLSRYELRLRVDVMPRLLRAFSISAYVLRRTDSLIGMTSGKNVGRVNRVAEKLIEYFRHVPVEGRKTVGEVFDDGWGQVRLLEARL